MQIRLQEQPIVIRILLCVCLNSLLSFSALSDQTNVATFDDLPGNTDLVNTNYAGLFWEMGNAGQLGNLGGWRIVDGSAFNHPFSPPNNIINFNGCTLAGIRFPTLVNVVGAYFARQGATSSIRAQAVRIHGYLAGQEIATTGWSGPPGLTPFWFQMDLVGVDRIVVESLPGASGAGYYGMDNLTYVGPGPDDFSIWVRNGQFHIRWSDWYAGARLQMSISSASFDWVDVGTAPQYANGWYEVVDSTLNWPQAFYRLIK